MARWFFLSTVNCQPSPRFSLGEGITGRLDDELRHHGIATVETVNLINPNARILLLGGYNPVPRHEWAPTINQYLGLWDAALAARFEDDQRVSVVRMADIVTPQRLSRYDSFHPGADAYREAAKRIAGMLVKELSAA